MKLTPAQQKAVHDKVDACIAKATAHYKRAFTKPTVLFTLRGMTAGEANYVKNTVNFNQVLFSENYDDMLEQTVPHEMAHLFTDILYPAAHRPPVNYAGLFAKKKPRRAKRRVHGREWQSVMRVLGVPADRCHDYDVANAQVKVKNKFEYTCDRGHHIVVGPVRHKRIQRGATYYCIKCRGIIRLVAALGQVTYAQAKEAAANGKKPAPKQVQKKAPEQKAPSTGTKLERCYSYYQQYATRDKELIIAVFVNEVGMTKAGATTYYYQCKKLYEKGI